MKTVFVINLDQIENNERSTHFQIHRNGESVYCFYRMVKGSGNTFLFFSYEQDSGVYREMVQAELSIIDILDTLCRDGGLDYVINVLKKQRGRG